MSFYSFICIGNNMQHSAPQTPPPHHQKKWEGLMLSQKTILCYHSLLWALLLCCLLSLPTNQVRNTLKAHNSLEFKVYGSSKLFSRHQSKTISYLINWSMEWKQELFWQHYTWIHRGQKSVTFSYYSNSIKVIYRGVAADAPRLINLFISLPLILQLKSFFQL